MTNVVKFSTLVIEFLALIIIIIIIIIIIMVFIISKDKIYLMLRDVEVDI